MQRRRYKPSNHHFGPGSWSRYKRSNLFFVSRARPRPPHQCPGLWWHPDPQRQLRPSRGWQDGLHLRQLAPRRLLLRLRCMCHLPNADAVCLLHLVLRQDCSSLRSWLPKRTLRCRSGCPGSWPISRPSCCQSWLSSHSSSWLSRSPGWCSCNACWLDAERPRDLFGQG